DEVERLLYGREIGRQVSSCWTVLRPIGRRRLLLALAVSRGAALGVLAVRLLFGCRMGRRLRRPFRLPRQGGIRDCERQRRSGGERDGLDKRSTDERR